MSDYIQKVTKATLQLNITSDALRRAASAWALASRDAKVQAFTRLSDAACDHAEARRAFREWYSSQPPLKKNPP